MIEVRPTETYAGVSPRPKILLPNHWVRFSDNFPDTLSHVKGRTFRIVKQQQVSYAITRIIKEACYIDINFSNDSGNELLYPDVANNLFEVLIGFKPGNYVAIPYFPANQPIYRLDYATMVPTLSDASLKYIGAIRPTDSPADNPTLKVYFVYRLNPFLLRLLADDGVAYTKTTMQLNINRCLMNEEVAPSDVTPKPIQYLDELKWLSLGPGGR